MVIYYVLSYLFIGFWENLAQMDDNLEYDNREPLHETQYQKLRNLLATGSLAPGQALSLRGLAAQFGGSVTPIRDAVWRLHAEHALFIGPTRRINVPDLGREALRDLFNVRALLEPEAAVLALNNMDDASIEQMIVADRKMNEALKIGDVEAYMSNNHAFHFLLYQKSGSAVLLPMIESLWVRFGPFMRLVYPDVAGMKGAEDHHAEAIVAIKNSDETELKRAIISDINDGLTFLEHGLSE